MADTVAVARVSTLIEQLTADVDRLTAEVYGRGESAGLRAKLKAAETQAEHLGEALEKAKGRIASLEKWQTDVKIKVTAMSLTLGGGSAGGVSLVAYLLGG